MADDARAAVPAAVPGSFSQRLADSSTKVCRPLQTSKASNPPANHAKSFASSIPKQVGLFGNSGAQNWYDFAEKEIEEKEDRR